MATKARPVTLPATTVWPVVETPVDLLADPDARRKPIKTFFEAESFGRRVLEAAQATFGEADETDAIDALILPVGFDSNEAVVAGRTYWRIELTGVVVQRRMVQPDGATGYARHTPAMFFDPTTQQLYFYDGEIFIHANEQQLRSWATANRLATYSNYIQKLVTLLCAWQPTMAGTAMTTPQAQAS